MLPLKDKKGAPVTLADNNFQSGNPAVQQVMGAKGTLNKRKRDEMITPGAAPGASSSGLSKEDQCQQKELLALGKHLLK
jgi:hypothetical protein